MNWLLEVLISNALVATGLAACVGLISLCVRRPALLHVLWVLVLLKLVTPPLVRIPVLDLERRSETTAAAIDRDAKLHPRPAAPAWPMPDAGESAVPSSHQAGEPGGVLATGVDGDRANAALTGRAGLRASLHASRAWLTAAWLALVAGGLYVLVRTVISTVRFRRLVNAASAVQPDLARRARELSVRLGMRRCPTVRMIPARVTPMLWSLFGTVRLLFPQGLISRLDERERDTILVHELAHVHRGDHWVRYLEIVATCLYWWHPVLWWARRELRAAEEECCDAWVLWTLPDSARDYASALLETLNFVSVSAGRTATPPPASGVRHVHQMRKRLTMIMHEGAPRRLSSGARVGVALVAGILLAMFPTWNRISADGTTPSDDAVGWLLAADGRGEGAGGGRGVGAGGGAAGRGAADDLDAALMRAIEILAAGGHEVEAHAVRRIADTRHAQGSGRSAALEERLSDDRSWRDETARQASREQQWLARAHEERLRDDSTAVFESIRAELASLSTRLAQLEAGRDSIGTGRGGGGGFAAGGRRGGGGRSDAAGGSISSLLQADLDVREAEHAAFRDREAVLRDRLDTLSDECDSLSVRMADVATHLEAMERHGDEKEANLMRRELDSLAQVLRQREESRNDAKRQLESVRQALKALRPSGAR